MIRPNKSERITLPAGGLTKAEADVNGTTVAEVQTPKRQADREP